MFSGLKRTPVGFLSAKVWQYSKGHRRIVVTYITMSAIANAIALTLPLIIAHLFNVVQQQGITTEALPHLLGLLLLIPGRELAFWLLHGPSRVLETTNAIRVRNHYKQHLVDGILDMPMSWHANHHSGDTIDKIEKGTSRLSAYAEDTFALIRMGIYLVGAYAMLTYFDFGAGLIALAMVGVTFGLIMRFDRTLTTQYRQLNQAENRVTEKVVDIITNITTVVILRIQRQLSRSVAAKMAEPYPLYVRNIRLNEFKWFLASMNTKIMAAAVLGYYFMRHTNTPIAIGTLYALWGYTDSAADTFYHFASQYGDILRQNASVANAEELSQEFHFGRSVSSSTGSLHWQEMRIEGLTFSYHSDEEGGDTHLDDVNLAFRRGERIALVGSTGCGKTTLLKVMRELYDPQNVRIYRDGRLLEKGFAAISSEIALVPQEPEIFADTILKNITIGEEYPLTAVERFTDMARFTEVAHALPKQFQSSIKEKGVNLSGGQKQRLALARGLLFCQDKSIILLDEPTSSVDVTNERAIYENIFRSFPDTTVISSVHHLHLLSMFHRIYLFSDGRVSASGTFDELIAQSEQFSEMWQQYQASPDISE